MFLCIRAFTNALLCVKSFCICRGGQSAFPEQFLPVCICIKCQVKCKVKTKLNTHLLWSALERQSSLHNTLLSNILLRNLVLRYYLLKMESSAATNVHVHHRNHKFYCTLWNQWHSRITPGGFPQNMFFPKAWCIFVLNNSELGWGRDSLHKCMFLSISICGGENNQRILACNLLTKYFNFIHREAIGWLAWDIPCSSPTQIAVQGLDSTMLDNIFGSGSSLLQDDAHVLFLDYNYTIEALFLSHCMADLFSIWT